MSWKTGIIRTINLDAVCFSQLLAVFFPWKVQGCIWQALASDKLRS